MNDLEFAYAAFDRLMSLGNSRLFATPPLVSPRNDVWETSTDVWETSSILMMRHYPDLGSAFWLVVARGKCTSTNQRHYPDLGCDASYWDVISKGNHWYRQELLAVFSGCLFVCVFIVMCASFYLHALMFCVIKSLSKTWCFLLLNDLSIFIITMLTVIFFFLEFVYSLYFSSVLVNLHVLSYQSSLSPLQGSPRVNTERNYAASILSRILPCDLLTYSPSCPVELIYY